MRVLPAWLSATLASDATNGQGVAQPGLRPLDPAWRIAAPAFVVQASHDDNLAVVTALGTPPPAGAILVVSGHATSRTATIGDIMAADLKAHGVVGLVTDGLVRDASEIRKLGFPVWCRGTTPTAPLKLSPGRVGGSVDIGGALVRDGDLVIADDDGVVVWPQERIDELLEKADARRKSDEERLAKIRRAG
jgi:regulator of RNase E activity RraA